MEKLIERFSERFRFACSLEDEVARYEELQELLLDLLGITSERDVYSNNDKLRKMCGLRQADRLYTENTLVGLIKQAMQGGKQEEAV